MRESDSSTLGTRASKFKRKEIGKRKREKEESSTKFTGRMKAQLQTATTFQ